MAIGRTEHRDILEGGRRFVHAFPTSDRNPTVARRLIAGVGTVVIYHVRSGPENVLSKLGSGFFPEQKKKKEKITSPTPARPAP